GELARRAKHARDEASARAARLARARWSSAPRAAERRSHKQSSACDHSDHRDPVGELLTNLAMTPLVPRSWMLDFLVQQTARFHAGADADRLSILEKPTSARYAAYLARIRGFEATVEAAIATTPGIDTALLRPH